MDVSFFYYYNKIQTCCEIKQTKMIFKNKYRIYIEKPIHVCYLKNIFNIIV